MDKQGPDLQMLFDAAAKFHCSHTRYTVIVTFFANGAAEVRHSATGSSTPDDLLVELGAFRGEDEGLATGQCAQALRRAGIACISPKEDFWSVDGDALRELVGFPEKLSWLAGWRVLSPKLRLLRHLPIGLESEWRIFLHADAETWRTADPEPWKPRWSIVKPNIGTGGQATIHKAIGQDGQLGALKVLHREDQVNRERRFRLYKEVGALQFLDGAGTPRVLESNVNFADNKDVVLYAVLEWVEGRTLHDLVSADGPLSFDQARELITRLARTLQRLHDEGHSHRDLHPRNVILRNGAINDPVLIDFGMTSWEPEEALGITGNGQELGNRFLRLPEFAPGMHENDPASDVTVLCGLLIYLLAGQAPRQLADPHGRPIHQRLAPATAAWLDRDPRWPRIARLLDEGFHPQLERRLQSTKVLIGRLEDVDAPLPTALVAELAALSAHMREDESLAEGRRTVNLLDASLAQLETYVDDVLYKQPIVARKSRSRTNHAESLDFEFFADGEQYAFVDGVLTLKYRSGLLAGSYRLPHLQSVSVFTLETKEVPVDAIKRLAHDFLRDALRIWGLRYRRMRDGREYVPPFRDLAFSFPIGILLEPRCEQDGVTVALTAQNNSVATLSPVHLSILVPVTARAETADPASPEPDGRYVRISPQPINSLGPDSTATLRDLIVWPSEAQNEAVIFSVSSGPYRWTQSVTTAAIKENAAPVEKPPREGLE